MTHHATEGVLVPEPNGENLAYLAGLIDGEGHFKAVPLFKASGRNRGLPAIQIGMNDRAPLDWCGATFAGKVYTNGRSSTGRKRYVWMLTRQEDLRYLLPLLLPHLKVKGPQAWALLRVVETLRAQPTYSEPTSHLRGSRTVKFAERDRRRAARLRWRADVALAQASVVGARAALSNCNPPT